MLSLKDFNGFSLEQEQSMNTVGGNYIEKYEVKTSTGIYTWKYEFTDDDICVKSWIDGPPVKPGGEK